MKKIIRIPLIAMLSVIMFISCKPSTKEEVAAQENVEVAKEDLAIAKKQANQQEWQSFKNDMNAVIDKNDARIAELKEDMKKSKQSANEEYDKKVDALKEKNEELKLKMKSYKNDADSDWQSFKEEFNHDTNELGKAFKDLTVNNK